MTLAVAGALACLAMPAAAQTAVAQTGVAPAPLVVKKPVKKEADAKADAKAEAPAAASAVEVGADATVTVSANRPSNRIDRQVYDVKTDVGASNGSAADALNNVPSVAVDPDGTVTLRGSTNVQVYVDGKRSAMMQGDNRAATLTSMPAEDIESVEVINNPGAQFGNDGGGGPILNLVMRRTRRAGGFGSISANAGTNGRYNSFLSGSYNTGRFGMQGGAYLRHEVRNPETYADRLRIDPVTGTSTRSTQQSVSDEANDTAGFNTSLTYNLGDKDTLGAGLTYSRNSSERDATDRYVSYGANGAAYRDYVRSTRRDGESDNVGLSARLEHKGDSRGEVGKMDLRISSANNENNNAFANLYTIGSGSGALKSRQANASETRVVDLTGDYELPGERGIFKTGYKAGSDRNTIDTRLSDIDPVTGVELPNALRSNSFALHETNLALYGSYELRLNPKWGVQGGLRAEHTTMDVKQLTSGINASNNYLNFIPSMFVSYVASEDTDIRFTYAHRIRRPGANDLNPFIVYRDEFNVSSGNPNLKPTRTDSFELAFESKFGAIDTNLRGYYRKDSGIISERKVFISDTVLLTTRDNAGSNQSGGLEFNVRGKLTPKLTLNASGNLAYTEQRIFNTTVNSDAKRSTPSLSGRLRVNYTDPKIGQMQFALNAQGKTLARQGYRQPTTTGNFSYRLPLSPVLSLVANVTDIFDSGKIETITDTDTIKDSTVTRQNGRVVYVGLMYRFGGVGGGQGMGRRGPGGPGGAGGVPGGGPGGGGRPPAN
ncbi:MAG: TonB-dependent receptor [Pseudomonadota bacterium]